MRRIRLLPYLLLSCLLIFGVAAPSAQAGVKGREFPTPTANSYPGYIAAGLDAAMWFTEYGANKIGRIATPGTITEFLVPTESSYPLGIAAGPDGALWFTEYFGNKIGRISVTGSSPN